MQHRRFDKLCQNNAVGYFDNMEKDPEGPERVVRAAYISCPNISEQADSLARNLQDIDEPKCYPNQ